MGGQEKRGSKWESTVNMLGFIEVDSSFTGKYVRTHKGVIPMSLAKGFA